jgi:hypothetical protein
VKANTKHDGPVKLIDAEGNVWNEDLDNMPINEIMDLSRQLAQATGKSLDECLAALLEHGGRQDEAAMHLLLDATAIDSGGALQGQVARGKGKGKGQSKGKSRGVRGAEMSEADAKQLAQMTGRSLDECLAALLEHGGRQDEAAMHLLLDATAVESGGAPPSPARPPAATTAGSDRASVDVDENAATAVAVKQLSEVTRRPLEECFKALRKHGSVDAAAAALLDTPETSELESLRAEPSADEDEMKA